jgi:hypothetical protein
MRSYEPATLFHPHHRAARAACFRADQSAVLPALRAMADPLGGLAGHLRDFIPHETMKLENAIRALAGTFILVSLALAHYVSPNWLWFTAFVGANLLQSAFTGFCPAEAVLKKFGLGRDAGSPVCKA